MKTVPKFLSVADANNNLSSAIADAQSERIVITKHGRPVAMLVGCEGYDMEAVLIAADPTFWAMIEKRRKPGRRTVSMAEVRRQSVKREAKEKRSKPKPRKRSKTGGKRK